MNLLKSLFISCFVGYLALLSIHAVTGLLRGAVPLLSWLGLSLAAFAPLAFFVRAFLFKTPRTQRHPVGVSVPAALGLAMTLAGSWRYGDVAGQLHIWAGVTLLLWLVYLRWYSTLKRADKQTLRVGESLPQFDLDSLDGQPVSSAEFMSKPQLLLFYRGNWCPFCTAQILADRFGMQMTFLTDPQNNAARRLGLVHRWGTPAGMQILGYASDSVMPTVILTDATGTVIYLDETDNYRVRPEPANQAGARPDSK